ncbi:EAL domain-containing protein [Alteromonas pelagimontana]|uniref:EAL domain-containing protein n=1 Tax=Alteromonas pelagimontana TaxID=1858656 RepID=A0A6M4MH80_9ALTE|nr:EAL domain-containing protein [Alteromonas pelagimontana]QJR82479.1 EAL domain-containing protein [Alteromonas pelagimontana]
MEISLRQSIFRILLGGVVFTAVLILLNVWTATSRMVNNQVERELNVAQSVFTKVVEGREQQLINSATVLTADFSFKQAVATGDIPTIASAWTNQRSRIHADLMVLLDLQGNVINSQPQQFLSGMRFPLPDLLQQVSKQGGANEFIVVDGQLYQMILLPVGAPTPVAIAGIGLVINEAFLVDLKAVIQADIIISTDKERNASPVVMTASLAETKAQHILQHKPQAVSWLDITMGGENNYDTRELMLPNGEVAPVDILMAVDISDHYKNFSELQFSIISISLVAMVFSLAVSMLLSRRVSKPVAHLVKAVEKVAEGDYEQSLNVKGRLSEISNLASAFSSMQRSIKSREDRIRFQAQHDLLTGLFNRSYIEHLINQRMDSAEHFQVIAINLLGFRTINDLYGYANGDYCLKILSERLLRWPGVAGRLSGSEILYIPEQMLSQLQLETLRHILEQPVESDLLAIPMKVVFAEIRCPGNIDNAEDLFRKVNIVIDEAVKSSQWLLPYEQALEKSYLRRLAIITELKNALVAEQAELSMVYQPKVFLSTLQICSMEALVRWNNKLLGFVPPDEFIAIAEQAGMIEQVTTWVMRKTINDLAMFRAAGHTFTIAMNLSSHDIQNRALLDKLADLLAAQGLEPTDLELEITESDLVADADLATENLRQLKAKGFRLAIDDFGTGYSSLAYLKHLPIDTIKIDKSFVLNLSNDVDDQQIVRTILHLASVFELKVVAEGVEDEAAFALLRDWHCDIAQGYFISKPLSIAALTEWLAVSPYSQNAEKL